MIKKWKRSVKEVVDFYDNNKPPFKSFFPRLFLFFVIINVSCYWWATVTAFPWVISSWKGFFYYFKIQVPVGILGAIFDSLSFFITLMIIRRAIETTKRAHFYAHLSIDLIIAIAATFWILFVFSFSSWLIRLTEFTPRVNSELAERQELYKQRIEDAINNPAQNLRNIYFGIIMGMSAMLPTLFHIYMSIRSKFKSLPSWLLKIENRIKARVIYLFSKLKNADSNEQ